MGSVAQKSSSFMHPKFGKRHIVVLWLFFGWVNINFSRTVLNVGIVSMVNSTMMSTKSENLSKNKTETALLVDEDDTCPVSASPATSSPENNASTLLTSNGEFNWDHNTMGIIKSCFYYGYICSQFIGGILPRIVGGRLVFGTAMIATGIITLLIPIVARTSIELLIVLRVIQGLFQGTIMSCNHYLLGNWVPRQERSFLVSFPTTGSNIGAIIGAPLVGVLCEHGFDGGWPTAFYVFGSLCLLWCVTWFYFVTDSPSQHATVSIAERSYIEENSQSTTKHVPLKDVPWKAIFISPAVWAATMAATCHAWNIDTLRIETATYLRDVLHISASLNGVVTSIPFICMWVCQLLFAYLSDLIIAHGVSTKVARKCIYVNGMIGASALLVSIGYVGCNPIVVICLLCVSMGLVGAASVGYIVNTVDIAPQYASILVGITNTFSQLGGIVSPLITGSFTNKRSASISAWLNVFYVAAAISTFGAIFFLFLGDGKIQKWAIVNNPNNDNNSEEKTAKKSVNLEDNHKELADNNIISTTYL